MSQPSLHRTVDLKSAIFILIGFIVGSTIFVLPGTLAVDAGPAVFLAYMFAGIPAIFSCFVMAQVGGAFPTSGACYSIISKVLSPYWGFIYIWTMISLAALVIPLVAFGFADYLQHFLPGANVTLISVLIIVLFVITNCLGMDFSAHVQMLLVLCFLAALVIFGVSGVVQGDPLLIRPIMPNGLSPVVIAAITAYFSYAGVFVIAEIAGEVKEPGKTIPRAILISFAVVILIYTLVPLALVMTLPWQDYADTNMAVITASEFLLPAWLVNFIAFGALFAAATSINGLLMGLSRDFYKGADVNLFPSYFSKVSGRTATPRRAVFAVGALSMIGVIGGGSIKEYVQVAVLGLMVTQIITGISVLKMPNVLPEVYQNSYFKLNKQSLTFFSWGTILFSAAFFLYLGAESPKAIVAGTIYIIIGSVYFRKRVLDVILEQAN